MTFDRFADDPAEGTFASDMNRARGYRPVTEADLTKAYAQYNAVGAKFGIVKKTDSDTALYDKAKKYVLDWWKKEKTDAALLDKPPASGSQSTPATGGSASTAAPKAGSASGSSAGTMSDTAMGSATGTTTALKPISISYFSNIEVALRIKQWGIAGIYASSVPIQYRTSDAVLKNYLLAKVAAAKLASQYTIQRGFAETSY